MKSGAPFGASMRSPSPDEAANAGCSVITLNKPETSNAHRTAPQLTTLPSPRFGGIAQSEVHRLKREVRVGDAEPVPRLVAIARVRTFPEPDKADLQPWPL